MHPASPARPLFPRRHTPLAAALALVLAAPAALAQATAPSALSARRIVIDSETGRPRPPEAEEIAAMKDRAAAQAATQRSAPSQPQPSALASHPALQQMQGQRLQPGYGATGHRLPANKLTFSIVSRKPDGTFETQCVAGEDAAAHALHASSKEAVNAK